MQYSDIITNNIKYKSPVSWWPKYAFHYTDIQNAISILQSGWLYGREQAESLHLMSNENASRQVINITNDYVKSNVRFYFRPLTPTQYHNEGYKHKQLRYQGDESANVPVPVFFLFDLDTLLQLPETKFSEMSQAGSGCRILQGVDAFADLNFEMIYGKGQMLNPQLEVKYRQAEVLHLGPLNIDVCLKKIICRNDIKRDSLLNLLRSHPSAYDKYVDKVFVKTDNIFEYNGLFISRCDYFDGKLTVSYSHTKEKMDYLYRYSNDILSPIRACTVFSWSDGKRLVEQKISEYKIFYDKPMNLIFTELKAPLNATALYVSLYLDECLMGYIGIQLSKAALL